MDERVFDTNLYPPSKESISVPKPQEGQILYAVYLMVFGTIFAPKWNDLSDISKEDWNKFAMKLKNNES